jgi:hypothetical protein
VPHHQTRIGVNNFESILTELERTTFGGLTMCLGGPPVLDAFDSRKRLEDARGFGGDTDAVKNVGHF